MPSILPVRPRLGKFSKLRHRCGSYPQLFLRQLGCLFEYGAPRVQASSALPATNEFPSGSKQSFDSRANFPMAHEVAALQRIQPSLQLRQIVLRIEIVPDHGLRQFFGITPGSARRASRALPLVQE